MDGDRPLTRIEDDRLGFTPVAEHLASTLVDQAAKDGIVIGVEGRWGSGKSTLINLTIDALRRHGHAAPEIVMFSPWLVGDRDTLLKTLFDDLAAAAIKIDPIDSAIDAEGGWPAWFPKRLRRFRDDRHWKLKQKAKLKEQLGKKLEAFGAVAGVMGKVAKAAGAAGIPAADAVGEALTRGREATSSFISSGSLTKRKSELVAALRQLSRRIVVFVDDLDRLEPSEASEVLRLIRAVADFPNVIYVLSYDPDVVGSTLQKAVQVDDGRAFLEKIVQVSFRVPRPEAFDLRRWFQTEVEGLLFAEPERRTLAGDQQRGLRARLAQAINLQGGKYLETPRDVIRALNALRLHAIPVRDHVDLADMVWLQLVRIGNSKLYEWVEYYLTEVAAVRNGAHLSDDERTEIGNRLNEILVEEGGDVDVALIELGRILPGVGSGLGYAQQDQHRVFNNLGDHTMHAFVVGRRLGSPQHYRYYFAFVQPAGSLRDEEVQIFIASAQESPENAAQIFGEYARSARPQGGTMADVLIDRIAAVADRIPAEAIPGILIAFAQNMDDIALSSRDGDFGQHRAWAPAERAVSLLLRRTSGAARAACINVLFSQGRALGWLTSILRGEIFAHGYFGDRAEPQDQWLLTAEEFKQVLDIMLARFRSSSPNELLRVPNLMSLLYGWQQGAQNDEARRWVEAQTADDAGLLAFLPRARAWVASDQVYYPLRRQDLENFLDYSDAVARLQRLAIDPNIPRQDRDTATEMLEAVRQGERD